MVSISTRCYNSLNDGWKPNNFGHKGLPLVIKGFWFLTYVLDFILLFLMEFLSHSKVVDVFSHSSWSNQQFTIDVFPQNGILYYYHYANH